MKKWDIFFEEKLFELSKLDAVYDIGGGAAPQSHSRFKKYVVVDKINCINKGIIL